MVTITMGQHTTFLDRIGEGIRYWFSQLFSWMPTDKKSVLKEIIKMGLAILLSVAGFYLGFRLALWCVPKLYSFNSHALMSQK